MSQESKPSQSAPPAASKPIQISQSSLAGLASDVVSNCLYNLIHDVVLDVHRSEKLLRMQSAATLAEQTAVSQAADSITTTPNNKNNNASQLLSVKIDTPGATYDNGKITLKGNPLKTTPEILCPSCHLPRLLYPTAGPNSRPSDPTKQYCTRHPFIQKTGHDIHGQPFAGDADSKPLSKKKDKDLLKSTLSQQQSRSEKDSTPSSSQDASHGTDASQDAASSSAEAAKSSMTSAGGPGSRSALAPKPANYVPWQTCPTCKRSLLITRFAQHMEKCLGIGGRQSSRAALAKMSGNGSGSGAPSVRGDGGSSTGTPMGSRGGTPAPGSQNGVGGGGKKRGGDAEDGEDEDGGAVAAAAGNKKKVKRKEGKAAVNGKEKSKAKGGEGGNKAKDAAKRLPKADGAKREREKDDTAGDSAETPRKKLKISLGGANKDAGPLSAVSAASTVTGGNKGEESVADSEA
ncbi:MAG: hypothetical protein M1822_001746 [Bathelium mastoideum]|nr:MAG: hypothetical protein M1822_001746 [Bathelium mastoideum]